MMNITSFSDFLAVARTHSLTEPQRILLVFAGADLPLDATPRERERFARNEGGELTPLMCVDKSIDELSDFEALVVESVVAGPPWSIVFTAALSGRGGVMPTTKDSQLPLQKMIDAIKVGHLHPMLPFNRNGEIVRFL